jgi:5-oxoprolinase (ATP-hydrolysing)
MQTAITDAALARTIESFIAGLGPNDPEGSTLAMNSAGGLVSALRYAPCESLLSGPAAGVVGAVASARSVGEERIIAFDMGGTSTDVSRYAGRTDLMDETTVGRASVRVPSIDLDSVAAGGGSICAIKADRLVVGPESSGAHPGPACYGAGGPLSLTDVNLLLGRVDARNFGVPLHPEAADEALAAMLAGTSRDPHATLEGFLALANERMAQAIRTIAVRRGDDPATHTLVAFGGAGPQHACAVADRLGIQRILIPADTGILSAVGLHASGRHQRAERAILAPLCDVPLQVIVAELEAEALHRATADGVKQPKVLRRQVRCRLHKQEATIDLECDSLEEATTQSRLKTRFEAAFERRYGYRVPDRPIEVAAIRIFAGTTETHDLLPLAESKARTHARRTRLCSRGEWIDASSIDRASLGSTDQLDGPALLVEPTATTIVDAGWAATVDPSGAIVLNRFEPLDQRTIYGEAVGEIVTCRLESIARDMGEALRRTALSVNVRERLDYSCAILDSEGRLIVNAPHMPVHLGALGVCVRAVRDRIDLKEGDVALVNHPAFGGSHLPDLTVVSPAIVDGVLIGFLASRAHHAEIGGTRPGSMPPDATRLVEEGVVFEPRLIVQGGQPALEDVARRLATSPFPSRLLEDNLADLDAQIAANHLGVQRLAALYRDAGAKRFTLDLEALRDRCRRATASIARRWPALDQTVVETLDDGTAIQVRVRSDGERLAFDFTGTSTQHPGNLNAPHAVTTAAVLYVLRVLSEEAIPMNEGALDGVSITIPQGSFLSPTFLGDPREDPAVAIGNTETSQRIVDTLLRAFGVAACSQGTMNNTLLGTDVLVYYETVCGGAGAIEGEDGCSAVHTHMTNTRITDPEILEWRMPVRLNTFALRPDSGGRGRWRGGDGVIREIEALEALDLSVLGQHRTAGPYGLEGGEPGAPAEQFIVRRDGTREALRPIAAARLQPGDTLHLHTPGGGGFGPSP